MNKTLEQFYTSVLAYAGLKADDDFNLVNVNEKLGAFTLDGKPLTLPYQAVLANPKDRHIFHPLHENYAVPVNAQFNLYKSKLVFELNLKLSAMILSIIRVSSDPLLQQRIKSSVLVEMVSSIGETDLTMVDNLVRMIKACQNHSKEAFFFDIFLKKNGEVDGVPFSAIGKLNFHVFQELQRSMDSVEDKYTVYGCKLRKKDVLAYIAILQAIFPLIATPDKFTIGTDHKVFRMFNALLLTSYQVASRLNEVSTLFSEVHEPSLELEAVQSDTAWSDLLETLYGMTAEIRLIPDQTNLVTEGHQLKLKEPKLPDSVINPVSPPTFQSSTPPPVQAAPVYQPPQPAVQQPVYQQPMPVQYPQQVVQQTPSPEDVIRGMMQGRGMMGGGYQQAGFPVQQVYQQPMGGMMAGGYPQQVPMQTMGYPQQQVYQQPMQYMQTPYQPVGVNTYQPGAPF